MIVEIAKGDQGRAASVHSAARTWLVAGAALLVLSGCGSAAPQAPGPSTVDNKITGFKFQPNPQRVHVGDTIRWTNLDTSQHTATSDVDGQWDSPRLDKAGVFEHRFPTAGSFKYHCAVHPFMHGEIVVGNS